MRLFPVIIKGCYTPDEWDWELRHEILDQFLTLPGGLDCIINGLEQILKYPIDPEEVEIANGVLKLVQEQSGRNTAKNQTIIPLVTP